MIYTADENGYRAKVLYEGEAVHDTSDHPTAAHSPVGVHGNAGAHSLGLSHHDETPVHHPSLQFLRTHGTVGHLLHESDSPKAESVPPPAGKATEVVNPLSDQSHQPQPLSALYPNEIEDEHPSHVTHFPISAVGPAPPQFEFNSLVVTSPSQLGAPPHPHPIIKSHNIHHVPTKHFPHENPSGRGVPQGQLLSLLQPNPIVKSHAHAKSGSDNVVKNSIYNKELHRFVRGTNFQEYSTSSPIF